MIHYLPLLQFIVIAPAMTASLTLMNEPSTGQLGQFAVDEIKREATARDMTFADGPEASRISISVEKDAEAAAQSYRIERDGNAWRVIGADQTGAMYGGLDIAEAIRTSTLGTLKDSTHKPHIERRGIKFNIPLDLRTPSYFDNSTSAQANIPEMWSLDIWNEFLDHMARDRFNVLTLWNLHPFPSIVKVPEYPKIALNDVWRTKAKLDDTLVSGAKSERTSAKMICFMVCSECFHLCLGTFSKVGSRRAEGARARTQDAATSPVRASR